MNEIEAVLLSVGSLLTIAIVIVRQMQTADQRRAMRRRQIQAYDDSMPI